MGCTQYVAGGMVIGITSDSDDYPCLCTVREDSHNGESFTAADVRSFAALGAAVVLAHRGTLSTHHGYGLRAVVPSDLPSVVHEAIERFIPVAEEARQ